MTLTTATSQDSKNFDLNGSFGRANFLMSACDAWESVRDLAESEATLTINGPQVRLFQSTRTLHHHRGARNANVEDFETVVDR
jgi:hypothetical protein